MSAPKNQPIGTCPCPFKGCEAETSVFKFRGRSDNPARHRYAGRLYCVCPKHGRIESQEWILENARIETAAVSSAAPVADQAAPKPEPKAPPKPAVAPVKRSVATSPAPPAVERARERWGFFE